MSESESIRTLWRGGGSLSVSPATLPTPAQRCLVRAASGPVSEMEEALADWRALVDLTGPVDGGSYRLIPIIFYRLQAAGLDDPNRGMFKGVYRLAVVETARLVHAVTPVVRALDEAGLAPMLAKGAGLVSAGYYPTFATRPMSDIDIVVNSTQRHEAFEVLESLGHSTIVGRLAVNEMHAAPFTSETGGRIDLHWHHLAHARSAEANEIIERGSQRVEFAGVPVRVLGPTGLLIVSAVHGLVSNLEPPIRWLVDAAAVLERDGDQIVWDDVMEFASRFRLARRIENAFRLLADTTGWGAPENVMAALAAIPTRTVERVERRIWTAPPNSRGIEGLSLLAHYAGGNDRKLRHFAYRFPRYIAQRGNLKHLYQLPAYVVGKLWDRFRSRWR